MRLTSLNIRNYRTLEDIDLSFPSSYAAICGANDSGKTNVVRAIRTIVKVESIGQFFGFRDDTEVSMKDDFPKWKDAESSNREISFEVCIELDSERDVGFYSFTSKQLSLPATEAKLQLSIAVTYRAERVEPTVAVTTNGETYTDLNAQEVLKKLQSSRCVIFHNSTKIENRVMYPGGSVVGHLREITGQHEALINSMKKTVNRGLAKLSKSQQEQFADLLGRLQTKYKVGLSTPAFDLDYLPFSITLGENKYDVPLDDWGSGTRNRTLVLLALFRARQIGASEPSASKITPVMIVEEPESFLHPSAQAEFGRVLQDLAEEFQVQVLVTTHSPYLLNLRDPPSNVLLKRRSTYRQLRDTERVDTTGENWMAPFGHALGLNADEFKPWKALLHAGADNILLVEGDIDREYFELLQDAAHGAHQLNTQIEITSYGGTGSLSNTILLRFVMNRYRKLFITFDLDSESKIEKVLHALELKRGTHYMPVGLNSPGKKTSRGFYLIRLRPQCMQLTQHLCRQPLPGPRKNRKAQNGGSKGCCLRSSRDRQFPVQNILGSFTV